MQRQAVTIDLHGHRVDQKGHVVVDDLDDGVGRLPAVFLHARIEYTHADMAGLALTREIPVRQRGTVEIDGFAFREVLRIDMAVIARDESLERGALVGGDLGVHKLEDLVQLR